MISSALWVSCFGLYLFITSQSHNDPGVKNNLLLLSCFSRIFLLLEPDPFLSPCLATLLIYLSVSARIPLFLQFPTAHLCAVISLMATLLQYSAFYPFFLFFKALSCTKSQKLQSMGEPVQHGGTYLDLSQPWHGGHSIQRPMRHKGGTHKGTHLLNHSAGKSTFKPEKHINQSSAGGSLASLPI